MTSSLGPKLGPRLSSRPASVRVPSGFGWTPAFAVRELRPGVFTTSIQKNGLRVSTTRAIYVDGTDGLDANAGTSTLLPKKSINAAINLWSNDTIYVKAGWYPIANSWSGGVPFGANQNIIGVASFATLQPGKVISSVSEPVTTLSWTDLGSGRWSAAVANAPYAVANRSTAAAAPTWFTLAASAVAVNAPGKYYWAAGTLTVATLDGAQPGSTLRVLRDGVHNGWLNTGLDVTVENLEFEGGGNLRSFFAQHCGVLAFVDCEFTLSEAEGFGLQTAAAAVTHTVYHVRTTARWNTNDGIQYTAVGAGTTVRALEWDCLATANGTTGGSNQGSTGHFTAGNTLVAIVRVGGRYRGNEAQEVADVGGCKVWMPGVEFDGQGAGTGFYLGDAGTAWLQGCTLLNCATDLETDAAGGTINLSSTAHKTHSGAGTVQNYAA